MNNQATLSRNRHVARRWIAAFPLLFVMACVSDLGPDPLDLREPDGVEVNQAGAGAVEKALPGDTPITQVAVALSTGGDDKRGDSRVWITVRLWNGATFTKEAFPNQRFLDWTVTDYVYVPLPTNTRNWDVRDVVVSWRQGGGGFNGDNWNMQQVFIWSQLATGSWNNHDSPWGNPLRRFTGSVTTFTSNWIP